MYRKPNLSQLQFENFTLHFGGKLRSDNRRVILDKQIPWQPSNSDTPGNFRLILPDERRYRYGWRSVR
jgi:hypothetical protein